MYLAAMEADFFIARCQGCHTPTFPFTGIDLQLAVFIKIYIVQFCSAAQVHCV